MLNEIQFCGRWEAERFVSTKPWVAISITDPGSEPAKLLEKNRLSVLRLQFHDLDQPALGSGDLFTPTMARRIIAFVIQWAPHVDGLLTHCEAGISRSAAVAAFVSKALFHEDGEYFTRAIPNRLVLGTLMKEWQRRQTREAA